MKRKWGEISKVAKVSLYDVSIREYAPNPQVASMTDYAAFERAWDTMLSDDDHDALLEYVRAHPPTAAERVMALWDQLPEFVRSHVRRAESDADINDPNVLADPKYREFDAAWGNLPAAGMDEVDNYITATGGRRKSKTKRAKRRNTKKAGRRTRKH